MQNKKKFKAPNGVADIRVALDNGHITIIGQEFISLSEMFWAASYAGGAISEDMAESKTIDEAVADKVAEVKAEEARFYKFLKRQLRTIYDSPNGNVDRNGFPIYRRVISLVKKTVKKDLIMKAWEEIKAEEEAED